MSLEALRIETDYNSWKMRQNASLHKDKKIFTDKNIWTSVFIESVLVLILWLMAGYLLFAIN